MALLVAAFVFFILLLLLICAYALLEGGPDERAAAIIILMAAGASQIAGLLGSHWEEPEIGIMIVDASALAAFVVLAHRSRKFWPIWAAAPQLVATLTHILMLLVPSHVPTSYGTAQPFWAFPVLGALAIGTLNHQLRRKPSRIPPSSNTHNT